MRGWELFSRLAQTRLEATRAEILHAHCTRLHHDSLVPHARGNVRNCVRRLTASWRPYQHVQSGLHNARTEQQQLVVIGGMSSILGNIQ